MNSVYCEATDSVCCEASDNQIFNHNFVFVNIAGDFPAGWQKCKGNTTADIYWEQDDKQTFSIKIINHLSKRLASICQQRSYCVPVYEKQVWEIGAILKVKHQLSATIKVHFISRHSRTLYSSLDFLLEPGSDYYYGLVTVPSGADYACIEVGTQDVGTLGIEDVVFKRVFPIEKYDMDAQGRLNINTVDAVKRIIDPVNVIGNFELKRETRDVFEDVVAGSEKLTSRVQDVLHLATYTFCVINQGDVEAMVRMQSSPNGINWSEEKCADDRLEAGEMKILTCNCFLRYNRIIYWTEIDTSNMRIYFQGQG